MPTILFVDRERVLADALARGLDPARIAVWHLPSARDAQTFLRGGGSPDLLVLALDTSTDHALDFLRHTRHARPWIPVLVIAGPLDAAGDAALTDLEVAAVLPRACPVATLVSTVQHCLAAR